MLCGGEFGDLVVVHVEGVWGGGRCRIDSKKKEEGVDTMLVFSCCIPWVVMMMVIMRRKMFRQGVAITQCMRKEAFGSITSINITSSNSTYTTTSSPTNKYKQQHSTVWSGGDTVMMMMMAIGRMLAWASIQRFPLLVEPTINTCISDAPQIGIVQAE